MSDLISRKELKKTKKRIESMPWVDERGNRVEFEWTSEIVDRLIDNAPSAEKKGRWVKTNPLAKAVCSECGKSAIGLHVLDEILTRYCPNCGAKMEVNEE